MINLEKTLQSRIPNCHQEFKDVDIVDPERGRQLHVDVMKENLPAVVLHCLREANGAANVSLLAVNECTLDREGAWKSIARSCFGAFMEPPKIEEVDIPAFQDFIQHLRDSGLNPFLSVVTLYTSFIQMTMSTEICSICISADEARAYLLDIRKAEAKKGAES